jgi:hypothetical protein
MAKKNKKLKITAEQIYTMERSARRQADIEMGVPFFKHKAHKSAKDYTRKPKHKKHIDRGDE